MPGLQGPGAYPWKEFYGKSVIILTIASPWLSLMSQQADGQSPILLKTSPILKPKMPAADTS